MIEQSDDLDSIQNELELLKQLKHCCLLGDIAKTDTVCDQFREQADRLVELCKMLNQVAATNKMKIFTKSLAIWFEQSSCELLATGECLARNSRSPSLKDCLWAQIKGKNCL